MKVNLEDIPSAIENVLWRCRQGLRNTRDHQFLQVLEPQTIDLDFEVIIRKDELSRIETSERDPTTTTAVTGEQVSTSVRTGGGTTTDSTETSDTDDTSLTTSSESSSDAGGESGNDFGGDFGTEQGTSATDSTHSTRDLGGEVEDYLYVDDIG